MGLATIPGTLDRLLAQSSDMHRHLCPRQVLGARMGMLACELLCRGCAGEAFSR